MNNHSADRETDRWLQQQGIDPIAFADIDILLLQAQIVATRCLKHHGKLLGQNEAASLNTFLRAMSSGKARRKLRERDAHRVLNIGAQVNRKLFKQHRQLNRR